MLKRISPREVTLGMFVHSFEGEWRSHPFWRSRFLITDPGQVDDIRGSGVAAVIVDLASGVSPAPAPRRELTKLPTAERLIQDLQRAKRVAENARRVMKKVFDAAAKGDPIDAAEVDAVVQSISDALDRDRSMLLGVMRLKSRHEYTHFHSVAVGALMINFARELRLPEDQVRLMGLGGLFHDIGKTRVPAMILDKPGSLTEAEFDQIRKHPAQGHELLCMADGVPAVALDVSLHHHEKMDGSGYPFGLKGKAISLAARMGAICDVYDALISARAYKGAASPVASIAMMASWQGHFDPDLLFTFMKSIGVFPVGMPIRLESGHLAIARDNGRRASRARLTIFYDIARQCLVPPHDLYVSDINGSDLIVEAADPEELGLRNWPQVRDLLLSGRDPSSLGGG